MTELKRCPFCGAEPPTVKECFIRLTLTWLIGLSAENAG